MGLSTQSLSLIYILPPDFEEAREVKLDSILETLSNALCHHFYQLTKGPVRIICKCIRAQLL